MSGRLWKAFYEDDVDSFRQLLETATYTTTKSHAGRGGHGAIASSPSNYGTPPSVKARKVSMPASAGHTLSKADINSRDSFGRTLLHHAASSSTDNAIAFTSALVGHPMIDLYLQDYENGWTPLHRAFYFGNVTIGRLILERAASETSSNRTLIKIKDREGNGPLDLYAATIKDRTLRPEADWQQSQDDSSEVESPGLGDADGGEHAGIQNASVSGDQLFTFGSNQNVTLGFGDQDDRQFPERIGLRRPEHLIRRFYRESLQSHEKKWAPHDPGHTSQLSSLSDLWIDDFPFVMRSRPLIIRNVFMSKLHTAVLTSDPESNLYMCGHGQGGRLGTGDARTRFHFVCVEGGAIAGKRIATVALGLNHTLALSDEGDIFSWGSNGFGQLGYSLPKGAIDEEPTSLVARQIYGPLKRETLAGIAASRVHSVAYTSTSLFTFGKNDGQLGIMDSDARSLETQTLPRKVAASQFTSAISSVAATDKATICLLGNHDVWIFANYGFAKVQFPLESFTNFFLKQTAMMTSYDHSPNRITKIISEGDTMCALSSRGEIYTLAIGQRLDEKASASTTNPAKIRNAFPQPQRVWSPKKSNMAARDVGVDVDGSIILSTKEGSVWRRIARSKIPDKNASGALERPREPKSKDFKFSRIPGLTRVLAVRSSGHGAYAAVRRDCDVLQTQIVVEDATLWKDMYGLMSLRHLVDNQVHDEESVDRPRFWQPAPKPNALHALRRAILSTKTIEDDLKVCAQRASTDSENRYDALLATTTSDVTIPVHRFMLASRSRVLRRGFRDLCETSTYTIPDLAVSEMDDKGRVVVRFQGLDVLTILDFALYLYTDTVVDFWHFTKKQELAFSYRQVRTELMKIAAKLELVNLEPAVRQMVEPKPCLDMDYELASADPAFFYDADVVVQLEDDEMKVHSAVVCTRCPFFSGLFMGRAGGRWLSGRGEVDEIKVDLKHITSRVFHVVLRHIYCDTGSELFDDIVSVDMDSFLDFVLDVMSAANELMLDRLSQIAQAVAGRFVNVRNVCGLLNAIAPSAVREFKDAGLEYLCLNLEAMLQGHHLNELDEDLLLDLDEVVRENQKACMPFAKSGLAERLLLDRHPELAAIIDRNRKARIDSVTLRSKFQDAGAFAPGSVDDDHPTSPMAQKARRRSSNVLKMDHDRPTLKAKSSTKELMFDMDEDRDFSSTATRMSPAVGPVSSPRGLEPIQQNSPPEEVWFDSHGKALPSPKLGPQSPTPGAVTPRTPKSPLVAGKTPPHMGKPWTLTPLSGARTDMREIMSQAASNRTSTLSLGLATAASSYSDLSGSFSLPAPRMSQKDRKRMQHGQPASNLLSTPPTPEPSSFSWHSAPTSKKQAPKEPPPADQFPPVNSGNQTRTSSTPQLTMRQTVAHAKTSTPRKPSIGPGSLPTAQHRSLSDSKFDGKVGQASPKVTSPVTQVPQHTHSRPVPQSVRHLPAPEVMLGTSISEIVAQQLAERDIIKEAAAKRDLQEIQAEQEFQEWWEKESARVQEAEQRSATSASKPKRHRGRGGKSGKGGRAPSQAQANKAA